MPAALLMPGYDLYRKDGVSHVDVPTLVVGARQDDNTRFEAFDLKHAGYLTSPCAESLSASDPAQTVRLARRVRLSLAE
jgi:DNA-binding NarL/FixJ family response regulator